MTSGSTSMTKSFQAISISSSVSYEKTCDPSIGRQLPSVKTVRRKGLSSPVNHTMRFHALEHHAWTYHDKLPYWLFGARNPSQVPEIVHPEVGPQYQSSKSSRARFRTTCLQMEGVLNHHNCEDEIIMVRYHSGILNRKCCIPDFELYLTTRRLPCKKCVFSGRHIDPTHAGYLGYSETNSPIQLAETYLHIYHESQGVAYSAFVSFFRGVG